MNESNLKKLAIAIEVSSKEKDFILYISIMIAANTAKHGIGGTGIDICRGMYRAKKSN